MRLLRYLALNLDALCIFGREFVDAVQRVVLERWEDSPLPVRVVLLVVQLSLALGIFLLGTTLVVGSGWLTVGLMFWILRRLQ